MDSARLDDERKREEEPLERAGRETQVEEFREHQGAEDESLPSGHRLAAPEVRPRVTPIAIKESKEPQVIPSPRAAPSGANARPDNHSNAAARRAALTLHV